MATEEHLKLKLEADSREWSASFTQAKVGATVLGTEVGKATKEFNKAEEAARKLGVETKKTASYAELLQKGLQSYNQAAAAFGTVSRIAQGAVELAKFSTEMKRLESAIPVETMRKLQEETKGTVSKMELLQRAAKDMGLSATAGMDEQALALKRGLADWSNFVDQAKASIGGLISTAIVGIVDLSNAIGNAISGEEQLRRTAGLAAENAAMRARLAQGWAAFDAAKAPELNDRTKQYFEQEAAQTLGIGKVFPKGVDAFVKGYKPTKPRAAGREADTSWTFGSLFQPTSNYGADAVRGGMGALGSWSQSANGVGGVFSQIGGISGGLAGGLGGAYESGAGGMRGNLAAQRGELDAFYKDLADQTSLAGAAYASLSSATMAAVEAAISGSDSIGRAALKATQQSLKAIALESTAKAAFSLAEGLFTGDPKKFAAAGQYALTAALAGGGSAVAGALAGSGSASRGPSSAYGPSSQPGGGNFTGSRAQSAGPQSITVNLYGTIAAGSKREVSEEVASAVDRARRLGTSRSEQTITVRRE